MNEETISRESKSFGSISLDGTQNTLNNSHNSHVSMGSQVERIQGRSSHDHSNDGPQKQTVDKEADNKIEELQDKPVQEEDFNSYQPGVGSIKQPISHQENVIKGSSAFQKIKATGTESERKDTGDSPNIQNTIRTDQQGGQNSFKEKIYPKGVNEEVGRNLVGLKDQQHFSENDSLNDFNQNSISTPILPLINQNARSASEKIYRPNNNHLEENKSHGRQAIAKNETILNPEKPQEKPVQEGELNSGAGSFKQPISQKTVIEDDSGGRNIKHERAKEPESKSRDNFTGIQNSIQTEEQRGGQGSLTEKIYQDKPIEEVKNVVTEAQRRRMDNFEENKNHGNNVNSQNGSIPHFQSSIAPVVQELGDFGSIEHVFQHIIKVSLKKGKDEAKFELLRYRGMIENVLSEKSVSQRVLITYINILFTFGLYDEKEDKDKILRLIERVEKIFVEKEERLDKNSDYYQIFYALQAYYLSDKTQKDREYFLLNDFLWIKERNAGLMYLYYSVRGHIFETRGQNREAYECYTKAFALRSEDKAHLSGVNFDNLANISKKLNKKEHEIWKKYANDFYNKYPGVHLRDQGELLMEDPIFKTIFDKVVVPLDK